MEIWDGRRRARPRTNQEPRCNWVAVTKIKGNEGAIAAVLDNSIGWNSFHSPSTRWVTPTHTVITWLERAAKEDVLDFSIRTDVSRLATCSQLPPPSETPQRGDTSIAPHDCEGTACAADLANLTSRFFQDYSVLRDVSPKYS